jgi:hypothetical protein
MFLWKDFMAIGSVLIGLLCLAAIVLVAVLLRRQSLARQNMRARYFEGVMPLFSDLRASLVPTGFPRISGVYQGREFDLQVVPDTLTLRKLPTLWLLVTLPSAQPVKSSLHLMMRPTGVESFSNFATLPRQVNQPRGYPADCAMRSDGDVAPALLDLVARQLAVLDQDKLKELVITPKGLRLVWLIEEADRGRYLIFRDAEMGRAPLGPPLLTPLLQVLTDLECRLTDLAKSEAA